MIVFSKSLFFLKLSQVVVFVGPSLTMESGIVYTLQIGLVDLTVLFNVCTALKPHLCNLQVLLWATPLENICILLAENTDKP